MRSCCKTLQVSARLGGINQRRFFAKLYLVLRPSETFYNSFSEAVWKKGIEAKLLQNEGHVSIN